MSLSSLIISLMMDFRTFILPRFVYVTEEDFDEENTISQDVSDRLDEISAELVRVTSSLKSSQISLRTSSSRS